MAEELGVSWSDAGLGLVAGIGIYVTIMLLSRVFSQRSLTTFSSFDFPITIAVGAIIGRTALVKTSLLSGVIALATLFTAQALVALARDRFGLDNVLDNPPEAIVADGLVLDAVEAHSHITSADLHQRLRMEGLRSLDQVRLMVLERSGSISIISGDDPIPPATLAGISCDDQTRQRLQQRRARDA